MQYLVVLVLMLGLTVLTVAGFLGLSYGFGVLLRGRGARPSGPPAELAAQFEADREWYEDLPLWQRNIVTVWWLANRYLCSLHERGEAGEPASPVARALPTGQGPTQRL